MTAKQISSDRRRSRPVTKRSKTKTLKKNKPAMAMAILIVGMLVFSGVYVIFTSLIKNEEQNPIALIETSMGNISVELFVDKAPITAGNFIDLAEEGYYDGLIFHRVQEEFMIQGGDPNGDGTGGHAAKYHEGYGDPDDPESWVLPDEFHPDLSNIRGTISMANRGENTGGSQFFINVANNTNLDYNKDPLTSKHPVFGKVIDGMNVADNISKVRKDPTNLKPYEDVIINKITIQYRE